MTDASVPANGGTDDDLSKIDTVDVPSADKHPDDDFDAHAWLAEEETD